MQTATGAFLHPAATRYSLRCQTLPQGPSPAVSPPAGNFRQQRACLAMRASAAAGEGVAARALGTWQGGRPLLGAEARRQAARRAGAGGSRQGPRRRLEAGAPWQTAGGCPAQRGPGGGWKKGGGTAPCCGWPNCAARCISAMRCAQTTLVQGPASCHCTIQEPGSYDPSEQGSAAGAGCRHLIDKLFCHRTRRLCTPLLRSGPHPWCATFAA